MYIHERDNWTDFRWDTSQVSLLQEKVFRKQGLLYGRLSSLGFDSKLRAMAENLTYDVVYSSEIEGIRLNVDQVRSSIARKLGIENVKYTAPSHYVDSVVGVMLEAVQHYDMPLSKEKLCAWQAAFFPSGYSEGSKIEIGLYRTNEEHIVSGMLGREKIHYIAPSPDRVEEEMEKFLNWFDGEESVSSVIRSAIAHFWFVSIHPFEDGNGRTDDTVHRLLTIKPSEELMHLFFYTVRRRSNIVNLLTSKHSADNMLLVCTVLSYFYLASFAITRRKESGLPGAQLFFAKRLIIILYSFQQNTHNRINIV